ncbi:DMT family transporter [Lentilitoribacter sp. EG35]|uniref:DMT family transporter n=1 Tax=Lentilitoribacter sp. EG35 TaxID=3234192 RepID=UPI00345F9558
MPKSQLHGHLAMLLMSFCIAGSFSLGSEIANVVLPDALTAVRFVAAAIFMGCIITLNGKAKRRHFAAPWRFLLLGAVFSVYFVAMFEALKITAPVSTSAVATLIPLMTAIFGYALLRQAMTKRMALALAIGAFGALWVIFKADLNAFVKFDLGLGEFIFFFGAAAHALYTVLFRKLNRGEPVTVSTFGVMVGGAIALIIYSYQNILDTNWLELPARFWLIFTYLVLITTSLTFFLTQFAALRLPSAKVMAYTYLVPSWVILWEWVIGNGLPDLKISVGVAITTIALLILLKNEEKA